MLTTFLLFGFLLPSVPVNAIVDVPAANNSQWLHLVSSSSEARRLDNLVAEYQALPAEGQTLFAAKLKSVQAAVQQSDQATQDYQNALNEARNPSNRQNDPQALRQKSQQMQELGRTAANLRRVAMDQLSQLNAEVSAYRRPTQRSVNRNRMPDSATQQPPMTSPDMQPATIPPFNNSSSQGFFPPPQSARGQTSTQPYSGSRDPSPQSQPDPGQYDPLYPQLGPDPMYGAKAPPPTTSAPPSQARGAVAAPLKKMIDVSEFKSAVADIDAVIARDLFVGALSKTGQFAIPPQNSSNKIAGVEYIVEGTIKEAKATSTGKSSALSFLRAAVADNLISVEVRVYEARTMSLIDTISARSGDINTSKKFGAEDAAGILGALTQPRSVGNGSDNAPENGPDVEKIEQRLEPLITEIAGQIATRYGAGQMQDMSGMVSPRGLASGGQQQPASSPKSQKGSRR